MRIASVMMTTTVNQQSRVYVSCRVMEKFYVGELVDNEMPVFPEMG